MKKNKLGRRSLSLLLALVLVCSMLPTAVVASEAENWAWDAQSGKLAVDYENFLSQHDLVYKSLPTDGEIQGMPVANGQTGAQVWQDDGIRMQIHSVDNAPHSAFSAAQVRLATTPTLDDSEGFAQRLNLYDGHISIEQNDGFTAEVFGLPNSETLAIHVTDTREDVRMVTFDIEMWQIPDGMISGTATNSGGSADKNAWKTITYFEQGDIVGFTKGISAKEPYGYAFAATVEGADFDIARMDDLTARLYITMPDDGDYTIYMSAASRLHLELDNVVGAYETANYTSTAKDVFNKAAAELQAAKNLGQQAAMEQFNSWWHNYWESSFVRYQTSNAAESDYLENYYYLMQYQLGGGAYAVYPEHFMRGVFTSKKDTDIQWNCGYWHFNQRAFYHGFLASNHVEGYLPYLDFYNGIMEPLTTFTVDYYSEATNDHGFVAEGVKDAMKTVETVRWDGYGGKSGEIYNNNYVGLIFSTSFEVAENMYNAYKYTMDEALLAKYYEYMRRTVRFITEWVRWDEETKQYHLDYSNSLEIWWKVNNATPDNAGIRSLIPKYLEAAKLLNKETADAELIAQAKDILEKLEPITVMDTKDGTGKRYAAYDIYDFTVDKTNAQSPELEVVYPHNLVGVDSGEALQLAINAWKERKDNSGHSYIWCVDGVQEARMGLGNDAHQQLGEMIGAKQKRITGYCYDGNGKLESMGLHISTMNEMLLQSYDDVIRVFPAVPDGFEGAFTLLASGGFLVSSEYADGAAKYIGINSQYGGEAVVKIPWAGDKVLVNGNETAVINGRISIATTKGGIYLIQPLSAKSTAYTTVAYTGTANTGSKTAFGKTLGIGEGSTDSREGIVNVAYDFNDAIDDGKFTDIFDENDAVIHGVDRVERDSGDYAADFSSGDYLEIPSSVTFDPMKDFSVSFDMKTTNTGNACFFDKYGSGQGFYLDIYGGNLRVIIGSPVVASVSAAPLLDGQWHKVQVDVNDGKVTVFFDGVEKVSTSFTNKIPSVTQAGFIGVTRRSEQPYVGQLDNFCMAAYGTSIDTGDDGLYAAYDFEDSTADGYFTDSLSTNNASISGVTTADRDGGKAAVFNGSAFLTIPHNDETFNLTEDFEVSFDIKPKSLSGNQAVFDKYGYDGRTDTGFYLDFNGSTLRVFAGTAALSWNASALVGGWHTVKVVVDTTNKEISLHVDGQKKTSAALTGSLPEIDYQNGFIGRNRHEGAYFTGELDNFRIVPIEKDAFSAFFDFETITDGAFEDSLHDYDAKIYGGVTQVTDADRSGKVASFDGTSGYLDLLNSEKFGELKNFTLSFDMKTGNQTNQLVLLDKYGKEASLFVDILGNGLRVIINGDIVLNTNVNNNSAGVVLRDNQWHTVKLDVDTDNGKVSLYFDGKLADSVGYSKSAPATAQLARIGKERDGGGRGVYAGLLDNYYIGPIPPVTVQPEDDTYVVSYNKKLTVPAPGVLTNDAEDPTGLSVELEQTVQHGTLRLYADGTFSYTPNENYTGLDSFTYTVLDEDGKETGEATVTLQVALAAETEDDTFTTVYGKTLTGSVVGNDTTGSGETLSGEYKVVFVPTGSQTTCPAALNEDGSFTFTKELPTTPGAHYDPEISFRYQVETTVSGVKTVSEPATVTIRVSRESSPSLYYDFESDFTGGITDTTGNGNTGTIIGSGITKTESGTALFDGTSYIQIPHSATTDLYDEFEVSMKVKTNGRRNQVLIDKSNVPGTQVTCGFYMDTDGGRIRIFTHEPVLNVACPFTEDAFTEVRVLFSKENGVKLYLDGELAGTAEVDYTLPYVNSHGAIGKKLSSESYFFLGEMDDFRICSAAVGNVEALIKAIGDVTLDSEDEIEAAREAFDALTDEQKADVRNEDVLEAAEKALEQLQAEADQEQKDKAAAKAVEDAINALPSANDLTLDDEEDVAAAREALTDLTDEQEKLVSDAAKDKLAALEDKLDELQAAADKAAADQKAADEVEALIDALPDPDEVQLSDKEDIEAAREAYDDLTDEQKALVTPAVKAKLENVEAAYKKLKQLTVLDTIVAIGGAVTGFPFDDVKRTDWFYDEVKDAWNNDLIDGVTKDAFMPEKELTVAQAIKLAAALHQKDYYGHVTLKNGYPDWYSTYVDYAVTMGVIDSKYQSYNLSRMNAAVSREEFVSIFFGAMNNYTAWNEVADNAIPDVKMNDAFADEIYTFYRAGILTGSDAEGTFHPDSSIKRSEVAAILIRMYDTTARQSVTLK